MGERSKILSLPEETRAELDARLIRGGFSGYQQLEEWLEGQGYEIGKSSIHRYGTRLDQRINAIKLATDQAKAVVAASPDDAGDMSEALMRLMQEKLFGILLNMDIDPEAINLNQVAKAMAPLARASIAIKKHQAESREKVRAKLDAIEGEVARGQRPGISADALKQIREEVYGIFA